MGLQFLPTKNVSVHRKNQNTWIVTKYTIQLNKTRNGYLIVQVVLNKFTAEIQNANSIKKKKADLSTCGILSCEWGVEITITTI